MNCKDMAICDDPLMHLTHTHLHLPAPSHAGGCIVLWCCVALWDFNICYYCCGGRFSIPGFKESFYPFYVATALTRFFFVLDPHRKRKLSMHRVLLSRNFSNSHIFLQKPFPKSYVNETTDVCVLCVYVCVLCVCMYVCVGMCASGCLCVCMLGIQTNLTLAVPFPTVLTQQIDRLLFPRLS